MILTPLAAKPTMPRKIVNRVDSKSLELLGMTIFLPQGAIMDFQFENIGINRRIDPEVFRAGN